MAVCLALVPAAVWGQAIDDREKVTLRLWKIPVAHAQNVGGQASRAVYDAFVKSYPHIEVRPLTPLQLEGHVSGAWEFLAVAGDVGPDVWFLTARKLGDYRQQGLLAPLDRFLADYRQRHGTPYRGVGAPADMWRHAYHDGHFFLVPFVYHAHGLRVDWPLAHQAGLDIGQGPRNWEELYQWARAMTRLKKQEREAWRPGDEPSYGYMVWRGATQGFQLCQLIWSAGGQVVQSYLRRGDGQLVAVPPAPVDFESLGVEPLDLAAYQRRGAASAGAYEPLGLDRPPADSELTWQVTIDQEPAVAALRFIQRLYFSRWIRCHDRRHDRPVEFDVDTKSSRSGLAACPRCGRIYQIYGIDQDRVYTGVVFDNDGSLPTEPRVGMQTAVIGDVWDPGTEPWVMFPFPSRRSDMPLASHIWCHYLGISATASHAVQQAAWQYIEFVTSEKAQEILVRRTVELGAAFGMRPHLLKRFGYLDLYRKLPAGWIRLHEQFDAAARWEPTAPGFQHTQLREFGIPLDAVLLDKTLDPAIPLAACARRVNEHVMSSLPPAQIQKRERIGWIVLLILMGLIVSIMLPAAQALRRSLRAPRTPRTTGGPSPSLSRRLMPWAFLSAALGSVLLWHYVPLLRGLTMAFQDYKLLEGLGSRFIGLDHFVNLLARGDFYRYLLQTLWYVFLSLLIGFFAPIVLALLLHEVPRGKMTFRLIFYLPAVTTGVVTLFLWKKLLFDPTDEGVLNQLLALLGIGPQRFLQSPAWAMVCVIIPAVWAGAGPGCLIYLAALKGVPDELYEAAELDGAGLFTKLRHVLLPQLAALVLINFIGAVVGAFKASENIFLMTGGGPLDRTVTVGLDIWMNSFMFLNFGFATAEAWILGGLLVGFTVYQLRLLARVQFRTGRSQTE